MAIDITFGFFLLFGIITGLRKGLIHSVFSFIALLTGVMAAMKFGYLLSVWMTETFSWHSKYLPFFSFIILFIGVILFVLLFSRLLEKLFNLLTLNWVNKILGAVLWCAIVTIIFSTLLFYTNQINLLTPELKTTSKTYIHLQSVAPVVVEQFGNFLPAIHGMFESIERLFEELAISENTLL